MRFARRTKICFDTEMEFDISLLKPYTSALGKFGWLGSFSEAENVDIE